MSRDYVALKAAHKKRAREEREALAYQKAAAPGSSRAATSSRGEVPVSLVVGMGNPGAEFELTRHNVGFLAVDVLAAELGVSYWATRPGALVAQVEVPLESPADSGVAKAGAQERAARAQERPDTGRPAGAGRPSRPRPAPTRTVYLVKPQSYMNVLGGPVVHLAKEYGVPAAGILAIHDDLEVDPGRVRVRIGGGNAGHNGLRSLSEKLGTHDFGRVRTGIGRPPGRMAPADFVLKQVRGADADALQMSAADAARAAHVAIMQGIRKAIAQFA